MGQDKRFLKLQDRTLLESALSVLERLFSEVLIVVAEEAPELSALHHRVVTDLIPGCASLGGLYTGLSYASCPRVFAAACDMPFLNASLITRLARLDPTADVVMVQLATGLQPLHAVYSKRCLVSLEQMTRTGNYKVQDICMAEGLSVRIVSEEEIQSLDPHLLSFVNINTPADLELARKLETERLVEGDRPDVS